MAEIALAFVDLVLKTEAYLDVVAVEEFSLAFACLILLGRIDAVPGVARLPAAIVQADARPSSTAHGSAMVPVVLFGALAAEVVLTSLPASVAPAEPAVCFVMTDPSAINE